MFLAKEIKMYFKNIIINIFTMIFNSPFIKELF